MLATKCPPWIADEVIMTPQALSIACLPFGLERKLKEAVGKQTVFGDAYGRGFSACNKRTSPGYFLQDTADYELFTPTSSREFTGLDKRTSRRVIKTQEPMNEWLPQKTEGADSDWDKPPPVA